MMRHLTPLIGIALLMAAAGSVWIGIIWGLKTVLLAIGT